jgi:transposase
MPRTTQPKKTLQYTTEFKVKAVQLTLHEEVKVNEVAEMLDIHRNMLSLWRKKYREGKLIPDKRRKIIPMAKDIKELSKVKKLEKENARLRQENDLLKKWQRFLAEEQQKGSASSKDTEKNSE